MRGSPPLRDPGLSGRLLGLAVAGATLALTGAYLDDAWHTSRGRDSFFIAPHIAIYGGISLVGAVLALGVAQQASQHGKATLRNQPALVLAAIALASTMASAPIDNFWHVAFGRDAVLWSPPHLLGIVGTLSLGAAILLQTRDTVSRTVCGGLVLASANFVIAEFETDVPQFSEVLYLPVLAIAAVLALSLVHLAAPTDRRSGIKAALVHLAFVGAIAALLLGLDFPAPSLPIMLAPAIALDFARNRSAAVRAGLLAVGLVAATALRHALGSSLDLSAAQLISGGGLAFVATLALLEALQRGVRRPRPVAFSVGVVAMLLLVPAVALAHDPGQGKDAGSSTLSVRAHGQDMTLSGRLQPCRPIDGGTLVARRAGRTIRAALSVSGCSFTGTVRASDDGRWFVYADLTSAGRALETWLPVTVGADQSRVKDSNRFVYVPNRRASSPVKAAASGVIYLVVLMLVGATMVVAAKVADTPPRQVA